MKKKILIVGGSGFLGFNLLLKLNKLKNFKITAVSRNIPDYLKKLNKINLIKADFSKYNSLSKSLKKKNYDIVINFGKESLYTDLANSLALLSILIG